MNNSEQNLERSSLTLTDREFARFSGFIYNLCGIKLTESKKTMLEGRLQKRVRALGMKNFKEYDKFLFSPEGNELELVNMIDIVTTNKTDFFREPEHFDFLTEQVLPKWSRKHNGRRLVVWSAGCSTGQEPYTLAMVLSEFAANQSGFDFKILATDISTRVLEKAKNAIYDEELITPVPQHMKRKYLLRSKDRKSGLVRIAPELREKVVFRRLNFLESDFGLSESFDIIFCRNVIIYFDRKTQEKLLQRFYGHMRSDAHIFMGHSETLSGLDVPLISVYPTVYQKSI